MTGSDTGFTTVTRKVAITRKQNTKIRKCKTLSEYLMRIHFYQDEIFSEHNLTKTMGGSNTKEPAGEVAILGGGLGLAGALASANPPGALVLGGIIVRHENL